MKNQEVREKMNSGFQGTVGMNDWSEARRSEVLHSEKIAWLCFFLIVINETKDVTKPSNLDFNK